METEPVRYDITVDYGKPLHPPAHGASGTLTGFGERGTIADYPGDAWIDPIKYTSYRGSGWGGSFMKYGTPDYGGNGMQGILDTLKIEYDYLHPKGVTYEFFFPDVWSAWYLTFQSHAQPGDPKGHDYSCGHPDPSEITGWTADGYDWDYYIGFCTCLAEFVCDNGMCEGFVYDLWNEPDLGNWEIFHSVETIMWRRTKRQYYEMWKIGFNTIRAVHDAKGCPPAVIAGPSFAYTFGADDFFAMCVKSGTVPDVVTVHALDGDPVGLVEQYKNILSGYGVDPGTKDFYVQEYARAESQNPGSLAWYLARCERAGARGSLAVWGQIHTDVHPDWAGWNGSNGELNGVLRIGPELDESGEPAYSPTGLWWVYRRYAEITGMLYASETPDAMTDVIAGADEAAGEARLLLGRRYGLSKTPRDGDGVAVRIGGLDSLGCFKDTSSVRVIIERIPFNNDRANAKPGQEDNLCGIVREGDIEVVADGYRETDGGSVDLVIDWHTNADAYSIIIRNE